MKKRPMDRERRPPAKRVGLWDFARGRKTQGRKRKNRFLEPRHEVVVAVSWSERFTQQGIQKGIGIMLGGFVTIAVLIGGFSISSAGSAWWAEQDGEFQLTELEVEAHGHLTPEDVLSVAGIERGQSLLTLDLESARQRLEAIPSVSFARLVRTLPNKLTVSVEERVPIVRLGFDTNWVADRDGMVMEDWAGLPAIPYVEGLDMQAIAPGELLPLEEGRFLRNLMDLFGAMGLNEMVEIDVIDMSDSVYPMVFTKDCSAVTLSREISLKIQLARWASIVAHTRSIGEIIDKLDVTTEPGAVSFFRK